jgi:glutathione S-transferase
MKIYDFTLAPNPRRLRMFVAEKGLKIPYEQVDLMAGKNRTPQFLAKNPAGGLPVLELDDGAYLAESVAICRYLEALHPEPNLMGKNAREHAEIEMWSRRMELNLFGPVGRAFQHPSVIRGPPEAVSGLRRDAARIRAAAARLAGYAAQGQGIHRRAPLHDRGYPRIYRD